MVRSHAAAGAAITGNAYAAAKATGTAATETTEAAATASGRIAGTPHARLRADARVRDGRLQQEAGGGNNGAVDHGVFIVRIGR